MKQYIKGNITHDAASSVTYFSKLIAQCNECVLFMFLGLSTVSAEHYVDFWFILAVIVAALVFRVIGTVKGIKPLSLPPNKKIKKNSDLPYF